jgi:putative membrane protein
MGICQALEVRFVLPQAGTIFCHIRSVVSTRNRTRGKIMRLGLWAATTITALSLALPTAALAKNDKAFLRQVIKGNVAEIELGKLAAEKGSTDKVRAYGDMLVTDHTKAKEEAEALAKAKDINIPEKMKGEDRKELKKLKDLTGAEFDKEFIKLMVEDHEKNIEEFKEKAADGKDDVAKFAEQTLPTLEKHLKEAQALASGS